MESVAAGTSGSKLAGECPVPGAAGAQTQSDSADSSVGEDSLTHAYDVEFSDEHGHITGKQRFRWGGLSGKLLILTVVFVMTAEILFLLPTLSGYRLSWLRDRMTTAGVAVSVLAQTASVPQELENNLLKSTGALAISFVHDGRRSLIVKGDVPRSVDVVVDLGKTTVLEGVPGAFQTLFGNSERIRVIDAANFDPAEEVDMVLPTAPLRQRLRGYAIRILIISLAISAFVAILVYFALRWLFVRPLLRLTRSMDRFASAPENPDSIARISGRNDEVGDAEIRLAEMQMNLSRTLQQRQRLADLGLAVSKINHDLRNLLASAQLFMERLEMVEDPTVRRISPKIIAALDRAVSYTHAVLAYGKTQEAPPKRRLLVLGRLVDEVAEVVGLSTDPEVTFENGVPDTLEVDADPDQLYRVLTNLCRNAYQALEPNGEDVLVRRVRISASREGRIVSVRISDTGPGIGNNVKPYLFQAFQGSSKRGGTGLGLAITAELIRAHGGSIELEDTAVGTSFLFTLPDRQSLDRS